MDPLGVLGTGTMGSGIVQLAARSGHRVIACDTSVEALAGRLGRKTGAGFYSY